MKRRTKQREKDAAKAAKAAAAPVKEDKPKNAEEGEEDLNPNVSAEGGSRRELRLTGFLVLYNVSNTSNYVASPFVNCAKTNRPTLTLTSSKWTWLSLPSLKSTASWKPARSLKK